MTNETEAVRAEPVAWPNGEIRLWDTQWTNCINHDNRYSGWDKEDAIAHAIKMTERYMRQNYENDNHASEIARLTGEVEKLRYEAGLREEQLFKSEERTAFAISRAESAERRLAELESISEQLYQAAFFAQPFVAYAANNAKEPRLAKECDQAVGDAINRYRSLTKPEADHG